ncbi:MAG TPA: YihY/virulence factor BrkB family protein [Tepidisphaeraceae bacterium]|jgi:membrane protein
MLIVREYARISKLTLAGWWEIKAPRLGAALAYYTVLSLAPTVMLATPLIGLVFHDPSKATAGIVDQFRGLVGEEGARAVEAVLSFRPAYPPTRVTTYLGIAVLIFGATGVFAQLQESLNTVWGVVPAPGFGRHAVLSFLRQRFISFAMVLGICFLLLVSLVLSAGLTVVRNVIDQRYQTLAITWSVAHLAVFFVIITVLFAMMYKILPDAKVPWRDVWVGSVLTAMLFTLGKWLIGLYLGNASIGRAYGGAGSIVVLLVWVYYSAQIVFLGAEFTYAYHKVRGDRVPAADHAVPVTAEARAEQGIPDPAQVKATVEYLKHEEPARDEDLPKS